MDIAYSPQEKHQSTLIKAMRFPLIVLVIISHSLVYAPAEFTTAGWNVYRFFSEMVSHHFCKIAVCWFFVFAGYFFFLNLPPQGLTGKWLIKKWERRIWTLLIPYIIWNLLAIVIPVIKRFLFYKLGVLQTTADTSIFPKLNLISWFITGPANYPLWFMRDLMVMTLLSPLVYILFKKLPRFIGFFLLIGLFILPFDTQIITWRGYFFFSLGAFLGIHKRSIVSLCKKVKWPAAILAFITLTLATYFRNATFHNWLLRAFFPFGMISFMNLCDLLIKKESRCDRLCKLSAMVFFIYASHEIYILGWTKGLFLRAFGESLPCVWIRYILVPIVVVGVCMILFILLNKIMPRTLAIICGGRIHNG